MYQNFFSFVTGFASKMMVFVLAKSFRFSLKFESKGGAAWNPILLALKKIWTNNLSYRST
jgi:hypothetical protein